MKSRTKSTKANHSVQSNKPQRKSHDSRILANHSALGGSLKKKTQKQIRDNLEASLKLLQHRLNFSIPKKTITSSSVVGLTALLYQSLKQNVPPKISNLPSRGENRTAISFNSSGQLNGQRQSSQNILQYFKNKFGSPAKDQQSLEKKLNILKMLKKTQEVASRYHSNSAHSQTFEGSKNDFKQKVKEKTRKA